MELIQLLINHYGSVAKASRAMGVSRQHFESWVRQGFISFKYGYTVEEKTGGMIKAIDIWEAAAKGNIK